MWIGTNYEDQDEDRDENDGCVRFVYEARAIASLIS